MVERLEGETIPRKILRDHEWAAARGALDRAVRPRPGRHPHHRPGHGRGPAAGRPVARPPAPLDALGEVRPALELGVRWLPPTAPTADAGAGRTVTVHGDFRCGNLLVGPDGLRGVLDWELAHAGDPAEDIGWLCAPAWRFGGPGEVGGFGSSPSCWRRYAAAGGAPIDARHVSTGGRSTPP